MKNKKQIFTTILSVLVSVFLVAGAVFAITTIGTNITTEGTLSGLTKITIGNNPSSDMALKIHNHNMADDPAELTTANEFKSDSLLTSGGLTGLYSEALLNASGTASVTGIMGIGYGGAVGVVSTAGNIIGVSGGADVSGEVDGAGITIAGVVGGIMPMSGTLTEVKDMTALWGSSNALNFPATGDSELLLLSTGPVTGLDQAIKINGYDAQDRITNFVKFSNVTAGMVSITDSLTNSGAADILSDGYIKILVDGDTYYIPIYNTAN